MITVVLCHTFSEHNKVFEKQLIHRQTVLYLIVFIESITNVNDCAIEICYWHFQVNYRNLYVNVTIANVFLRLERIL